MSDAPATEALPKKTLEQVTVILSTAFSGLWEKIEFTEDWINPADGQKISSGSVYYYNTKNKSLFLMPPEAYQEKRDLQTSQVKHPDSNEEEEEVNLTELRAHFGSAQQR